MLSNNPIKTYPRAIVLSLLLKIYHKLIVHLGIYVCIYARFMFVGIITYYNIIIFIVNVNTQEIGISFWMILYIILYRYGYMYFTDIHSTIYRYSVSPQHQYIILY
jgi:hypothetical protein